MEFQKTILEGYTPTKPNVGPIYLWGLEFLDVVGMY